MTEPGSIRLRRLLDECAVLVGDKRQAGSGFFAGPGLVVTCAHVVGDAEEKVPEQASVLWRGNVFQGSVRVSAAKAVKDARWPFPDLSVIELRDGPADWVCLLSQLHILRDRQIVNPAAAVRYRLSLRGESRPPRGLARNWISFLCW